MPGHLVKKTATSLLLAMLSSAVIAFPGRTLPIDVSSRSSDALFAVIAAEIATHRGQPEYAINLLNPIQAQHPSADLAELIWHTAVQTRDQERILNAAKAWVKLDPKAPIPQQTLLADAIDHGREKDFLELLAVTYRAVDDKSAWIARITAMLAQAEMIAPQIESGLEPYWEKETADPKVQIAVGLFHKTKNNLAGACRAGKKAYKQAASNEKIVAAAADLCWGSDRKETTRMLTSFLKQHPNSAQIRLIYGRVLARSGQEEAALREIQKAVDIAPEDPVVLLNAGQIAIDCRLFDSAEGYLSRYVNIVREQTPEADLSDNEIWLRLANVHHENGHHEDEVEALSSLTTGPMAAQARLREAAALAEIKRLPEARTVLQKAAHESPENRNLFITTEAQLLIEANQGHEALQLMLLARDSSPDDSDLAYDTAMIAQNLGQTETAEELLKEMLAQSPDHVQANNALAYLWITEDRHLEDARRLLEHAYRLDPLDPYVLDSMGWLCFKEGRLDQAAEFTLTSLKKQFDVEVACHLIEILSKSGRPKEAEKLFGELLQRVGDDPRVIELGKKLKLPLS